MGKYRGGPRASGGWGSAPDPGCSCFAGVLPGPSTKRLERSERSNQGLGRSPSRRRQTSPPPDPAELTVPQELRVGDQSFGATSIPEASYVDLFRRGGGEGYQHVGKVTHRVTVRRSNNDSAMTSKLRSQNDVLQKEKESHRAILLSGVGSDVKSMKRPNSAAGIRRPMGAGAGSGSSSGLGNSPALTGTSAAKAAAAAVTGSNGPNGSRSLPGSPSSFGTGSASPNFSAYNPSSSSSSSSSLSASSTSATSLSSSASASASSSSSSASKSLASMTTSKKPLSSMSLLSGTMRVLHLLALGPNTVSAISSRTHLPLAEVEAILHEHGKESGGSGANTQYCLADNRYKDLRVWEWKHYSTVERSRIIASSIEAFDRLHYPPDHSARRNIIDPKLRPPKPGSDASAATSTSSTTTGTTSTNTTGTGGSGNSGSNGSASTGSSSSVPNGRASTPISSSSSSSSLNAVANGSPIVYGDPEKNPSSTSTAKKIVGAILKSNGKGTKKLVSSGASTPRAATSSPSPTRNNNHNSTTSSTSSSKKIKSAEYVRDSDEESADYEVITGTGTSFNSAHNTPRSGTPVNNVSTPRPTSSPSLKVAAMHHANTSSPGTITNGTTSSNGAPVKRKAAASGISSSSSSDAKVRKVARSSTPTTSKLQQPASEGDLFELARKFRDTYSEYAKLYSVLSARGKRPKSDIQRLLSMHRDLESWKQLLWASSPKMKKTSI
ncbi:RNA polymerase II transcription elongation factor SpELL [Sugiyamaella lignohabitans]|uniref:RNA polymerase II transcription elongation factor SpELL n=1 Tax=Sugiyamaella lignohabitans TaxID=796027 RepID=A0A167CCG3_9ASCO|nr:RNA polymerase II transcription elongation factor SpELL [Sugiyamaella lignohabitans]ANB11505.1 RNA polymerase II transcription elongation factor SpELL [Sugiyamaella lignohabitans]